MISAQVTEEKEIKPGLQRPMDSQGARSATVARPCASKLRFRREEALVPHIGLTREQLYLRARQLDIKGRSEMTKEELQRAVEEAEERRLEQMCLADLRDCAHAFDIEGRSKMSRQELVRAIRDVQCQCGG